MGKLIVVREELGYRVALELKNVSNEPVAVCTEAYERRSSQGDRTWYSSNFSPAGWPHSVDIRDKKEWLRPYVVKIAPGNTVDFKMNLADAMKPGSKFRLQGSYMFVHEFAPALDIWEGSVSAPSLYVFVKPDGSVSTLPSEGEYGGSGGVSALPPDEAFP